MLNIFFGGIIMKVIAEGKKIIGTMEVTCGKCEAVLEIEAKDLSFSNNANSVTPTYYYTCPCCSRTQYISHDELNEDVLFDLTHNH